VPENIVTLDRAIMKLYLLNVHNKDGHTPLHLAAAVGQISTVCYLLGAGIDVRSSNERGKYPLTLAAGYGRNDTVNVFLQGCCAVKCEEIMTSVLRAATGQVDTTALMIRSGAPFRGGENEKPIYIASRIGHKEIVSLLLQFGAS
jgi:ankyrin repeat protein